MKGAENMSHHSYTFSFLLVLILLHPTLSIDVNMLSSTDSLTISSNRTLVSPGGVFELGFFKPSTLSRWYLGIWYRKLVEKTYVWVANRDNPLSTSVGTLKISGNNLVLLGHSNTSVWSTNLTRGSSTSPVMAELLANGNFVVRHSNNKDSPSGILWQSFDFPTDTLLPEMRRLSYDHKTGRNRFLTSWRSSDDPSSGDFTYKLDIRRGLPEFFLKENDFEQERSGPWNGIEFSGMPEEGRNYVVYDYTETRDEVAFRFLIANQSIYMRLTINYVGSLYQFTLIPPSRRWGVFLTLPTDDCDAYKSCGPYAYCDLSTLPRCNCFEGFHPKNQQQWDLREGSDGCVRRTPLSCSGNGFSRLKNMKLPDAKMAIVDRGVNLKKCEERCLRA
ncbi:S-locus glycoprotein domain-containing protein [Hirschfeldia incana]|nr:S-locus glycoprotein domain-containing protein [Hirschfeldia incana]